MNIGKFLSEKKAIVEIKSIKGLYVLPEVQEMTYNFPQIVHL